MNKSRIVSSRQISSLSSIVHGFGTRGLVLEDILSLSGARDCVFFETLQMHDKTVCDLGGAGRNKIIEADAFITSKPNVACFVRTADCVPIILADLKGRAIGAVHSGWRGTAKDIVGEALRKLEDNFGIKPFECIACIGPRICGGCYEVGLEVIEAMRRLEIEDNWLVDRRKIDLGIINLSLLKRAGILEENIDVLGDCTRCDLSFASYRRDADSKERQYSFVMICNFCRGDPA